MNKNLIIVAALGLIFFAALGFSNLRRDSAPPNADAATWITSHDEALRVARESGKPILVDFFADWCGPCHMMDNQVFKAPIFQPQASRWVLLRIDVDKHQDLAAKYGASSLPMLLVLNSQGQPVLTTQGYRDPEFTLEYLQAAYTKATS